MPETQGPKTTAFSDIDLKNWKQYDEFTGTLWLMGARDKSGPHVGDYWGNFVPQVPKTVLVRHSKRGEVVLDLFNGMGTTLIECCRLGRHGIGVELQADVAERARERIARAENPDGVSTAVLVGDSSDPSIVSSVREGLARLGRTHVSACLLHPPYGAVIPFSDDARDLSMAPTLEAFLAAFGRVVDNAVELLEPGRFLALVIGDIYEKAQLVPLGFRCMQVCTERGLQLKAINVKDIQGNERGKGKNGNLWKYRALAQGFYIFKHEYVMVFRKPAAKG
jgi:tRNA G10  N-methylase Trm11